MGVLRALVVLTCAVLMVTMIDGASAKPVLHAVGGTKVMGWRPNYMNYTVDWASHEYFKVGDWLYFGYDKHSTYTVLQVNETNYQSCSPKDFIKNITGGAGRDVFNLTQAQPYYFLSGDGNCSHGMKLAILKVEDGPAPALAPTHAPAPAISPAHAQPALSPTHAPAPAPTPTHAPEPAPTPTPAPAPALAPTHAPAPAISPAHAPPAPTPTLAPEPAPSKNGSPEFAGLYRTFFGAVATAVVVLMMSTSNY